MPLPKNPSVTGKGNGSKADPHGTHHPEQIHMGGEQGGAGEKQTGAIRTFTTSSTSFVLIIG